jgi:membrane protein implicated in regulation of membrane protease activity
MDLPPALVWLAAGLVLLVAEMLAPGVFLMWLGIAALATGVVVHLFGSGLGVQVVAFGSFAALSLAAGLRLRVARRPTHLNTAQSGLVGRAAHVLSVGPELRVRIGDSDWTARLARDTPAPEPGATLHVVGVSGTTVILGGDTKPE